MKSVKEPELIKATEANDVVKCLELSERITKILKTYERGC